MNKALNNEKKTNKDNEKEVFRLEQKCDNFEDTIKQFKRERSQLKGEKKKIKKEKKSENE